MTTQINLMGIKMTGIAISLQPFSNIEEPQSFHDKRYHQRIDYIPENYEFWTREVSSHRGKTNLVYLTCKTKTTT